MTVAVAPGLLSGADMKRRRQAAGGCQGPIWGGKLILGATAFLLLTGAVFWYQFSRVGIGAATPRWDDLRWGYLGLLLLCLPIETLACGLRIWALARVLGPGVKLWTCIKAEWANVAISTLTPTQSGGGAGQIYILSRGGASVGTAVTVMLLSCLGTLVGLMGLALYSLLMTGIEDSWPLLLTVICSFIGIGAAMAVVAIRPDVFRAALAAMSRASSRLCGHRRRLGAWWPPGESREGPPVDHMGRLTAKLVDILYTYRADVSHFLRAGKATFAGVCLLSLTFLVSRSMTAYLCARFLGIEASDFARIFQAQIVVILVEFFAPSPGGAGVVETASLALMANIVPTGYAAYYHLLWRSSTLYVPALAGFVCLAGAVLRDTRRVIRPTWDSPAWAERCEPVGGPAGKAGCP